jgi:hypothetical protein
VSTSLGLRSERFQSSSPQWAGDVRTMSGSSSKFMSWIADSADASTNTIGCLRSRARSSVVKITAEPESQG